MVARDHEHETVAAERVGGEPPGIDGSRHDADVGDPFGDQADDLVGQPFLEVDADMGMRGQERAQGLGQELGERIGVRQDADLAGEPARIGPEVFAHPFGLRQDRAGVLQQGAARLRRRHPLAVAHQERGAERLLHVADARAGSGERQVGALGAMGDRARLHHVAEQAEVGEVETHRRSKPSCTAKASYAKH